MVQQGRLVKIAEGLLLHPSAVEKAREKIVAFLQQNPGLTMSQARDLLNTSRRYALPLMEYFDRLKVTRRKADCRVPY
jgi:selenocysteine-specific elongation factor